MWDMKDTLYEIEYESLNYILGLIKLFKKFYMTLESKYFFFVIRACSRRLSQKNLIAKWPTITKDIQVLLNWMNIKYPEVFVAAHIHFIKNQRKFFVKLQ